MTRVCNPDDVDALTPNDLLLVRPGNVLPCGIFDESDIYSRRRWRQIQYLSNLFWKRWTIEYLHLLQTRQKWLKHTRTRRHSVERIHSPYHKVPLSPL